MVFMQLGFSLLLPRDLENMRYAALAGLDFVLCMAQSNTRSGAGKQNKPAQVITNSHSMARTNLLNIQFGL